MQSRKLPLCVLLWGLASAKRVSLMTADSLGNNPIHFAANEDTAEVVVFLIQQTKGYWSEEMRLVDVRNHAGETALLRAMNTGINSVVQTLIEAGSDLFAIDHQGNTVFCKLAKCNHLWCMNLVVQSVCNLHGAQAASNLLSVLDNEQHTPLDWAADNGDVNMIEYLIRKGFNPYRVDTMKRGPLYWAVKGNHLAAARFLVLCGCDPHVVDGKGVSPLQLATSEINREMMRVLSLYDPKSRDLTDQCSNTVLSSDPRKVPILGVGPCSGKLASHAVYRINPSRPGYAVFYGLIVTVLWLLSICVPFFAWIPLVIFCYYGFKLLEKHVSERLSDDQKLDGNVKPTKFQKLILAPEKGLGVWVGSMLVYCVFLSSNAVYDGQHQKSKNYVLTETIHMEAKNPLGVAGIDAELKDPILFWIDLALVIICMLTWLKLVWFHANPGVINNRDQDFEEVMAQSLQASGPPPPAQYCRTTLVKKPLRSKYCAKMGFVVARMDHYCVWLNTTIGYGNHRTFIIFLWVHLLAAITSAVLMIRAIKRELEEQHVCSWVGTVLGREFFFVCLFCGFLCALSVGLMALTGEQMMNICRNITTNEKINVARYHYLQDSEGNFLNAGALTNFLEFWRLPGYAVDYTKIFEFSASTHTPQLSSSPHRHHTSQSMLTQENIKLNKQLAFPVPLVGATSTMTPPSARRTASSNSMGSVGHHTHGSGGSAIKRQASPRQHELEAVYRKRDDSVETSEAIYFDNIL